MKQKIKIYVLMTAGVVIAICGLNLFLVPNKIAAGGISGIATIIYYISAMKIPLWLSIAVLNVPLFVFGFKLVGRTFAIRTAYSLALFSALAGLIPIPQPGDLFGNIDIFLGSLYGGVLMGAGIGLVVRCGGSTGGTDMAARILSSKAKNMSVGGLVFAIDFFVIAAAGIEFDPMHALYAIASLYVSSKLIDFITVGLNEAKAFYIISDKGDEIADMILKTMGRGVTSLCAKGVYSGKDRDVLLCVLKWRSEGPKLKSLVKSIDEHAFVIVADVKEVLGEGF